jgi:alpha-beta hydrolase superfamily lysophospholipase
MGIFLGTARIDSGTGVGHPHGTTKEAAMGVKLWGSIFLCLGLLTGPALSGPALHSRESIPLDGNANTPIYVQTWIPARVNGLVVYTHGFVDNSRNQTRLYDHLLAHNYAVAAWDMIGHGTSFGMRGYVDDFSNYVHALDLVVKRAREKVPAGTPVYMLGHSLGGLVTLRYAELYDGSIAGSLYLAPFLQPKKSFSSTIMHGISGPLDVLLPRLVLLHGVSNKMLFRDPTILAERSRDPYFFKKITVHLFRQFLAGIRSVNAESARISKPVLFIVPGDELIVEKAATEAFFQNLSSAQRKDMVPFPKLRHEPQSDIGREAVLESLTSWLKDRQHEQNFR